MREAYTCAWCERRQPLDTPLVLRDWWVCARCFQRGSGSPEFQGASDDDQSKPGPRVFEQNYDRAKKSTREEERIAKKLGGRRLPRSGGLEWSRHDSTTDGGDLANRDLHIEHKRVEPQTKSVRVTRDWLAKVTEGAKRRAKIPGLVVSFEAAQGHEQDWLMLPLDVALRLLQVTLGNDA